MFLSSAARPGKSMDPRGAGDCSAPREGGAAEVEKFTRLPESSMGTGDALTPVRQQAPPSLRWIPVATGIPETSFNGKTGIPESSGTAGKGPPRTANRGLWWFSRAKQTLIEGRGDLECNCTPEQFIMYGSPSPEFR